MEFATRSREDHNQKPQGGVTWVESGMTKGIGRQP